MTISVLDLCLRRDRIVAPMWILLLSVPLSTVYVGSTAAVYPTATERALAVASIMASPAQRAMYGNIYNDSLGALGVWKAGMFHTLIAVAVILTLIRHTRADEEAGRAELLDSTVVGRWANLSAALLLCCGASMCTGLIAFGGLLVTGLPVAGSAAFAGALIGSGWVFTALAAVTAQLTPAARTARSIAFAALATAFAVRAVADVRSPSGSILSWLSPLGWPLQVRPFAGERWWVLLLPLIATGLLTVVAYRLRSRRDIGEGLLPEGPGPGAAAPRLAGAFGLAWRLDRGAVLLWTAGLCLYGLMIGSVAYGVGDQIGDSGVARAIVERLGGSTAMEQAFIVIAFTMLAMVASAFGVSVALRLHQEESAGRADSVLAGAVGRTRWLASHLVIATAAPALAITSAGVVAGSTYGAAAGDIGATLPAVVGSALVQLPAVWLPMAITVALFGLAPRFASASWAVLVAFVALYLLGSLSGFPRWLRDLEPYSHIPHVGTGDFGAAALLWLLALDVALLVAGVIAFGRRDVR